jgi:hypothetical protein
MKLVAIYQSFAGPRSWDDMEFERLGMGIGELPGAPLSDQEAQAIKIVEDGVRVVGAWRGRTGRWSGPGPQVYFWLPECGWGAAPGRSMALR